MTDTLASLADGLRAAATPAHLLWSIAGAALGYTSSASCPGSDPPLPCLAPAADAHPGAGSAFIMFGGDLLRRDVWRLDDHDHRQTPGESASLTRSTRARWRGKVVPPRLSQPPRSDPSSREQMHTLGLTFLAPALAALRYSSALRVFALALLALAAITTLVGPSLPRSASLFFGLALGLNGIDPLTGAARLSLEHSAAAGRRRCRAARHRTLCRRRDVLRGMDANSRIGNRYVSRGIALDDAGGLVAFVEALAARRRDRVSARRASLRRRGDPDASFIQPRAPARHRPGPVWRRRD